MGLFGRDETPQSRQQPDVDRKDRPSQPPPPRQSEDLTVISEAITVDGTLGGTGKILVDGRVKGSIDSHGSVTVATRGQVEASLHARVVTVSGRVEGNISADEKIEIEASGRVDGDITAPRILIKDGAKFRGQVNMRAPEARGEVATSSARKNQPK